MWRVRDRRGLEPLLKYKGIAFDRHGIRPRPVFPVKEKESPATKLPNLHHGEPWRCPAEVANFRGRRYRSAIYSGPETFVMTPIFGDFLASDKRDCQGVLWFLEFRTPPTSSFIAQGDTANAYVAAGFSIGLAGRVGMSVGSDGMSY